MQNASVGPVGEQMASVSSRVEMQLESFGAPSVHLTMTERRKPAPAQYVPSE
jgi:hypothetical protein